MWKSKTKAREPMLSGSIDGARVGILPNQFKKEVEHPDCNLFIAENNGERGEGGASAPAGPVEDDLPF